MGRLLSAAPSWLVAHTRRSRIIETAPRPFGARSPPSSQEVDRGCAAQWGRVRRVRGHLDLKETGYEHELVERAVALLGEDGFVATTLEDRSVAQISRAFPRVRTALSLGRHRGGAGPARLAGIRLSELLPMRRIRACGATGVAVHQRLARATVLREASRNGLFTIVWTVNEDRRMRAFLADPRVDVLITDRPRRAQALRG